MIPDCAGGAIATPPDWRRALADALRDPDALLRALGLDGCPERVAAARRAAERFGLLVPRGYLARMRPGDPDDPLLRQVLPLAEELETHPGYGPDPVGDQAARIAPGLLHKYTGRALLLATGACAVHCRYCFRRAYPHAESGTGRRHWARAFDRLAADPSIEELILSGGDPLTLTDTALAELFERAAALPRLRRLRIHTRLPVVLPERVDDGLCALLAASRLPVVMVVHANHSSGTRRPCRRRDAAPARRLPGGVQPGRAARRCQR
ncbi:MAG: hypothetical protein KatS3mg121_0256 [Gammaproteobacteria bacterium]|nr:MAG: hypothetical protein KatS3mg121_0256 [Gammaproteobacteria bacterium]